MNVREKWASSKMAGAGRSDKSSKEVLENLKREAQELRKKLLQDRGKLDDATREYWFAYFADLKTPTHGCAFIYRNAEYFYIPWIAKGRHWYDTKLSSSFTGWVWLAKTGSYFLVTNVPVAICRFSYAHLCSMQAVHGYIDTWGLYASWIFSIWGLNVNIP